MYECPNCGGNLKFDIASQQLACAFCGTKENPYAVEKETDAAASEYFEATVFTCPQCAGEIFSADNEAAAFCSFCGASTILSARISKEKRPKYIIPFKMTKEDCKEAYAKKMRRAFFVPNELRDARHIDGFRGIYMPYWTYQMVQNKHVTLKGEKSHRSGDYIITDHYDLKGDLNAYYLGYAKDASSSFYDSISEKLAPYDAKELVNFTPSFLSGFYADTADIDENVYLEDVTELANESTFQKIADRPEFKGYNAASATNKKGLKERLGTVCKEADSTMYPVWFLSYRNKDRVAYATVNGQTGKIVADMPIDPKKYVLSSLALAVVIFLLLNLFLTIKPTLLMGLSCLLVIVSAVIYAVELRDISRKEAYADDVGMKTRQKGAAPQEKSKKKEKKVKGKGNATKWMMCIILVVSIAPTLITVSLVLIWPFIFAGTIIIGVIGIRNCKKIEGMKPAYGFIVSMIVTGIALLIRLVNPVSDIYYYAGALLTLLAVLYNLFDVIRNYNRLAMRRLPQFDRQGGDDRA